MKDGKESLKDSSILEEENANLHEVSPQPMHVFATIIEEISDEDDLLDKLDAICSSIDIESSSPIYEKHFPLQQQVENCTIPVASKVFMSIMSKMWRFSLHIRRSHFQTNKILPL